jgi:peptide/nickel transport system ATP-binding protein
MSLLFISHDLGVVGEISDHVVVMRHGKIREKAPVAAIFNRARTAIPGPCWPAGPRLDREPGTVDGDRRSHCWP